MESSHLLPVSEHQGNSRYELSKVPCRFARTTDTIPKCTPLDPQPTVQHPGAVQEGCDSAVLSILDTEIIQGRLPEGDVGRPFLM